MPQVRVPVLGANLGRVAHSSSPLALSGQFEQPLSPLLIRTARYAIPDELLRNVQQLPGNPSQSDTALTPNLNSRIQLHNIPHECLYDQE